MPADSILTVAPALLKPTARCCPAEAQAQVLDSHGIPELNSRHDLRIGPKAYGKL